MRISLPSLDGFTPRSAARIAFSIAPICDTSQADRDHARFGNVQIADLIQRRRRAVIIDAHVVEQVNATRGRYEWSPSRAADPPALFPCAASRCFDLFDSSSCCLADEGADGSPDAIRIILPWVFRLKTRIGRLLSRHIAIEVASITPSDFVSTSV